MVRTDPSTLNSLSLARIGGERQPTSGGIPVPDRWLLGLCRPAAASELLVDIVHDGARVLTGDKKGDVT